MNLKINFSPGLLTEIFIDPPTETKFIKKNYLYSKETKFDGYLKRYSTKNVPIYDFVDCKLGIISIASGLVKWLLIDLLTDEVIKKDDIDITDTRDAFDSFDISKINIDDYQSLYNHSSSSDVVLRDYQFEGIKTLLSSRLGILSFPTSSGKGEIIVAVSKILQEFGQVLIIVPTMASLTSTKERLVDYGIKFYQYHKIRGESEVDGVILSTPKVIYNDSVNRSEDCVLNKIKYLLTNEVHHVQAKTWFETAKELPSVVRSYGFSATPDIKMSEDVISIRDMQVRDAMIRGTHGNILMEIKSREIDEYISAPKVLDVRYHPGKIDNSTFYNTDWSVMKKYLYTEDRIKFVADLVWAINNHTDLTTITFVSFIEAQGDPLFELYPPSTVCWYGGGIINNNIGLELDKDSVFDAIKNGEIRNVVITSHGREDINLPSLSVAIMLDLAKKRSIKQCVGRVVRKGTPSYFVNISDTGPKVLATQASKRSKYICDEYDAKAYKIYDTIGFIDFFNSPEIKGIS